MTGLRLLHSVDSAVPPPAELAPAEDCQSEDLAREPYVAQWMLDEGRQALRNRRAALRLRAIAGVIIIAAIVVGGVLST